MVERIEAARERVRRLESLRQDPRAARQEFLELRRTLREGGQLRPGDALSDRYVLLEALGRGGFATVWKAKDLQSDRNVAVKVLHPDLSKEPSRRERFFRGARIMASLDHPAVVRILEPVAIDSGYHYFVMELVEGADLHRRVVQAGPKGALTTSQVLATITMVGAALQAAHQRGVIHRDIKPQNILRRTDGTPLLTDFDLVAAADTTGGTRTGALGTFIYAAPEQLTDAKSVGVEADVYSLAMTMIFCLCGGHVPSALIRTPERVIAGLKVPSKLKSILRKATQSEPSARYRSMEAFCSELFEMARSAPKLVRDETSLANPETDAATDSPALPMSPPPLGLIAAAAEATAATTTFRHWLAIIVGAVASLLGVVAVLVIEPWNEAPVAAVIDAAVPVDAPAADVEPIDAPIDVVQVDAPVKRDGPAAISWPRLTTRAKRNGCNYANGRLVGIQFGLVRDEVIDGKPHFDFNFTIPADCLAALETFAKEHSAFAYYIVGHTKLNGSDEYELAVSDSVASKVSEVLRKAGLDTQAVPKGRTELTEYECRVDFQVRGPSHTRPDAATTVSEVDAATSAPAPPIDANSQEASTAPPVVPPIPTWKSIGRQTHDVIFGACSGHSTVTLNCNTSAAGQVIYVAPGAETQSLPRAQGYEIELSADARQARVTGQAECGSSGALKEELKATSAHVYRCE